MPLFLSPNPSLRYLKYEAKALLKAQKRGEPEACARLQILRRFARASLDDVARASLSLHEAQYALALQYGFASWTQLKKHVESMEASAAPSKGESMSAISKTDVPHPYDQYKPHGTPSQLDEFLSELVLSAFPKGSVVMAFHKGTQYAEYPEGNDRVSVRRPNDNEEQVIVLSGGFLHGVETEAAVLPVLARSGLPVSKVLAGPTPHPDYPDAGPFLVLSVLRGRYLPFIKMSSRASSEELDLTCRLLVEGVERLHATTDAMHKDDAGKRLPRRTLFAELENIVQRGGPWFDEPVFTEASEVLRPVLKQIEIPLVFSNFFYYTWSFLCDEEKLTGLVQFQKACFEDPHVGFTIYKIWGPIDPVGWGPLNRAGLVERWLYRHNVSREEFAPRIALRCLWRLQREHAVEGDNPGRDGILNVLRENLAYVK
jgi:hypothetical protein